MYFFSAIPRRLSFVAVFLASLAAVILLQVEPAFAQTASGSYPASLSFDPTTVSTTTGQSFTINVNVDTGGEATDGTRALVTYDPTLLSVAGVTNGTIYDTYPANGQSNSSGVVTIAGIENPGNTYTGSGLLASINFTANASGSPTIKFNFAGQGVTTDSNVADSSSQSDILGQTNTTTVTVAAAGAGAGASAAPVATPAPVATAPANQLPNTANTSPTVALAAIGGMLVALGASLFFVF